MNHKTNWNDFRLILAIERTGNLAEAARMLEISHATVFRHLNAIEKSLGVSLFVRGNSHYTTTTAGASFAATAAEIETRILDVESQVLGADKSITGRIRVTTTDTLLYGLVSGVLAEFQSRYPDVIVELSVSNDIFNLSRRDADVAIRPGQTPNESLVGRRIGSIEMAPYGRIDPEQSGALAGETQWIGAGSDSAYEALTEWMREENLLSACRLFTNSLLASYAAVVKGVGNAILPCYLGDGDARLSRIGDPVPALDSDLWLLTPPELRDMRTVKTFNDFVFASLRDRLEQSQVPS